MAGIGPQMGPGPGGEHHVNTADADATAGRVKAAGGQVLAGPFDVMDAGRMAVIADPTGAVLGVWQPGTHIGAQVVNEPGAWGWSELVTTDIDTAIAFSIAVFGWGADRRPPAGPAIRGVDRRRPLGGRRHAQAADDAGRGAQPLGRVLPGRRH